MIFSIPLFQVVIDLSYFERFIYQPISKQLFDAFLYVGWIPVVVIVGWGLREMWLISRQTKYAAGLKYMFLEINIPRENEQSPKAVEHIFSHIAGVYSGPTFKEKWWEGKFNPPFSFEYAIIDGYTRFIIRTPVKHRDLIEAAIFSQYPDAEIAETTDYTEGMPKKFPDPEWGAWGTEFVLKRPSAYPIRTYFEFEHSLSQELKDPLATVLESFSKLKKGEQVWIQILAYPIKQNWMKEGQELAAKMSGKEIKKPVPGWAKALHGATDLAENVVGTVLSGGEELPKKDAKKEDTLRILNMSPGERKTLEGIETKISKFGMGVKMRAIYFGRHNVNRQGSVVSMFKGTLALFGRHDGNSLGFYGPITPNTDYFWLAWSAPQKTTNVVNAYMKRSSVGADRYVLNIEELASLYHFPAREVRVPLIKKVESRKVEPPFALPGVEDEEGEEETSK